MSRRKSKPWFWWSDTLGRSWLPPHGASSTQGVHWNEPVQLHRSLRAIPRLSLPIKVYRQQWAQPLSWQRLRCGAWPQHKPRQSRLNRRASSYKACLWDGILRTKRTETKRTSWKHPSFTMTFLSFSLSRSHTHSLTHSFPPTLLPTLHFRSSTRSLDRIFLFYLFYFDVFSVLDKGDQDFELSAFVFIFLWYHLLHSFHLVSTHTSFFYHIDHLSFIVQLAIDEHFLHVSSELSISYVLNSSKQNCNLAHGRTQVPRPSHLFLTMKGEK